MKPLIYFTISHNPDYLKLLDICVTSLIKTGYTGDLLFITNLENEIRSTLNIKNTLLFFDPQEVNYIASSANKLKIFQYNGIEDYTKIIYCDLDVIWLKSPQVVFETIQDGKLYFSEEGIDNRHNMSLCYYSEKLITQEESNYMIDNNIIGLNAGFFGFHINMLYVIKDIFFYMRENKHKITGCLEQPFVNVHCYRNNLYNTGLTRHVSHRGQDLEKCDTVVVHFAGGVGASVVKYNKMLEYLKIIDVLNFDTREEMFLHLPKKGKILEIGVFKGNFSDFLFKQMLPTELHLIDLFEGVMCSGNADGNNTVNLDLNTSHKLLTERYKDSSTVFIKKGKSCDVFNEYPDEYFDIIYIDGDHSYEGVMKDLEYSLQKINSNGYICGHDYEVNKFKTDFTYDFGVKQAVDEFCVKYNLKITLRGNDGCTSFGIKVLK